MPTFTITEVTGPREWQSKYGPMNSFTLSLEGHDGPVEMSQKQTTTPPLVGSTVDGDIVPAQDPKFPPKLKKAQPAGGGNWSGGGGGMSPDREKKIVRQHSQSMSIETLKLAVDCGINLEVSDVAALVKKVKVLADVYDGDVGV